MSYVIGITDDAIEADGSSVHGDLGLGTLAEAGIEWRRIAAHPVSADDLDGLDAVYSLGHRAFAEEDLARAPRLRHIARFGAGYDTIDVPACTRAGVVVTNTPAAIRRPLALAALTLVLAVTHNLVQKHAITVGGDWSTRGDWRGWATDGATIGIVGFGSVGAELAGMLQAIGHRVVGNNRSGRSSAAEELGVELVALDDLLATADVVVLTAPLTPATRGMIGAPQLGRMRRDAAIVNVGRGGLVDTDALTRALETGVIRAAGLDVFDPEPLPADHPLLSLPNVTLTPHALCWTESYTAAVTAAANAALIATARGERSDSALNPEVYDTEAWLARMR